MKVAFLFILVYFFCIGAYSQFINNTTKIIFENNRLTTKVENTIKVNNKEESRQGEIVIPHGKDSNFRFLNAEIIDSSGKTVYKLKKKHILIRSNFSSGTFYQDNLVSEIKLFHNQYPYTIKYSYQKSVKNFLVKTFQ